MKEILIENVGFAVLAGGLSSRMGRSKPDLTLTSNNESITFIDRICDEFAGIDEKYISVNSNHNYQREGYISVKDEIEGIGPLGGIYSILKQSRAEAVFFLACDMPLYELKAAGYLADKWNKAPIAVSCVDNIREPLAGIYTKSCLEAIERQIESHNYKLGLLIDEMNGQYIDMSAYKKCYTNINTLEDYKELETKR